MGYNVFVLGSNQEILQNLSDQLMARDVESFCSMLREIAISQGGFAKLSSETNLNRESLYKALSGKRDPRLSTIIETLAALGMKLVVEIDRKNFEQRHANVSGLEPAWVDLYLLSPKERLAASDRAIKSFEELSQIDADNK